jgi:hypothetical protein
MKIKTIMVCGLLAAIFALAFIACETEPEPKHVHQWGEWEVTAAATCETAAEETRVCKLDAAHKETREGSPALGHDWNDTAELIPANETKNSRIAKTCKRDKTHINEESVAPMTYIIDGDIDPDFEWATGTAGLEFQLRSGNTYWVTRGTATGAIHIPAYHREDADSNYWPITEIRALTNTQENNAFGGTSNAPNTTVTSVTFAAESELTSIAIFAFFNYSNLTSVTLPNSVTSMEGAFKDCTSLTSVNVPTGLTGQACGAFEGCTSLTSITIPAGITTTQLNAMFHNCTSLTSVTILANLTVISYNMFSGCTSLAGITIPNTVITIRETAFSGCTSLTSITIPNTVTTIERSPFDGCTGLTSVTFAGTIASSSFNNQTPPFPGDLRTKFYATDQTNGTPGTYTRSGSGTPENPYVWTLQP